MRGVGRKLGVCLATIGAVGVLMSWAASASAATISVSSTADPAGTATECTLRQAIESANTDATPSGSNCVAGSGTDMITFAQSILPAHITLTGGELALLHDMTIQGPDLTDPGQVTVDGNDVTRVFRIVGETPMTGDPPGPTVTLSGLTVTGGHYFYPGPDPRGGAGIAVDFNSIVNVDHSAVVDNAAFSDFNGGSNPAAVSGGGILNNGTLNVTDTTVAGNELTSNMINGQFFTIAAARGAGIATLPARELHVDRSTISGNSATATTPSGPDTATETSGGGIWVSSSAGPVSVTSSTIANNTLSSGAANQVTETGGGIYSDTSAVSVTSDTITGNDAASGANILADFGAPVTLTNTVVADAITGANCSGVTSAGFNWSDDATCDPNGTTDVASTNPHLLALGDYGGPTQTRPPDAPSVGVPTVIDQGVAASQTMDQRGLTRTWGYDISNATGGDGTDVGAVEIQGATPLGSSPGSPGDSGTPLIFGSTEQNSSVTMYADSTCTNSISTDAGSVFVSPGLNGGGPYTPNTATSFTVQAIYGGAFSSCSTPFTYQRRPALPTLTSTNPASGGDNNALKVIGTATASSTVNIYKQAGCTGALAGTGIGADLAGTGIAVSVPDNSTTTFYAQATGVGGTSDCSTGLSYTEVTPAPPSPPANPTPTPTPTTPTKKKCKKKAKKGVAHSAKKCKKKK
jgi:hypothetical protein